MDKCKEITFCAKELLKTHRIHINDTHRNEVIVSLSNYIELLIFNIVAVVSIICANIGVKKVISAHIQYLSKYIDKRCLKKSASKMGKTGKMSGGAFNTAAFYGAIEPQYSKDNDTSDLLKIDFEGGIARNALNMTGGGGFVHNVRNYRNTPNCIKLDKIILKKIRNIFKFFNIKVEKAAIDNIKTKYDAIIEDLLHCIKNIKGEITCKKVDALILKSKFMKK
jgi:hypothetical protein